MLRARGYTRQWKQHFYRRRAREYRSSAPDCLRGSSLKTEIGKKRELSANNLRYPPRRPHRSVRQAGGPAPRPSWESCSLALELEAAGMGRHGSHSVTESVGLAGDALLPSAFFPVSSPVLVLPSQNPHVPRDSSQRCSY